MFVKIDRLYINIVSLETYLPWQWPTAKFTEKKKNHARVESDIVRSSNRINGP